MMTSQNNGLRKYFEEAIRDVTNRRTMPEIEIGFFPFAGLNSYISIRKQKVYVRLSDILRSAPRSVHRALAHILVAKLFHKAVDEEFEEIYRAYTLNPQVIKANEWAQRRRGHKRIIGPQGRVRDLKKAFQRLNRIYFANQLKMPQLTWSVRRTRNILGHLDHIHNTLVISRTLDDARVPQFLFDYILYHEMLHLKHRPRRSGDRCNYHTAAFLRDEQKFKYYDRAQKHLRKMVARWQ
jgi:hypothetical protein